MEQEKINYTIHFYTDWHAGSGLSAGAEADAVVIKDADGFPYIPGKTLKGLFVNAFKDFQLLKEKDFSDDTHKALFGDFDKETGVTSPGSLFFSNASLPQEEKIAIGSDHAEFLYRTVASTAIDSSKGVAKNTSLRTTEVCIPLVLEAYIQGAKASEKGVLVQLAKYIRSLGANRNRGLGRCSIKLS
ncbi:RAMP superfamily CRISPR-associated protein [Belliella sp. DSM 111904]|uniref:RAMP superfamily CRISPR-associated protein n=1 Tax=Belliella filtrata TaxID=2923435 RepID=A0ABS9V5K0_9BACT|nr:RAMP superfamily CRISPR-associated protein [Belliella filtrata]MCH7411420.1 RAMP superfamily CRISPR-associated protein [Belliella filtrata]